MEALVKIIFDEEANVFVATNDKIPLTVESKNLDELLERSITVASEIVKLNNISLTSLRFELEASRKILS